MIILRTILIVICITSLVWIALFMAGPRLLSKLITSFSNGTLVASNIEVTPRLDIKIGRLEYASRDPNGILQNEGLFRSVEVFWSISKNKPFFEIKSSSSLINKTFTTGNSKVYTTNFSNFNFEKIFLTAEINNPALNGVANSKKIYLEGFFEKDLNLISDVSFDISSLETDDYEQWFVNTVSGKVDNLSFAQPLESQSISVDTKSSELFNKAQDVSISSLNVEVMFQQNEADFLVLISDLGIKNQSFGVKQVIANGTYLKERLFKDVRVEAASISINDGETELPSVSVLFSNPSANISTIDVDGSSNKFDLKSSDIFIGKIPRSTFELDFFADGSDSTLDSDLFISLNFSDLLKLEGNGNLVISFADSTSFYHCFTSFCHANAISANYKIYLNEEWFSGDISCSAFPCLMETASHNLTTSNTIEIFKTLGQTEIFNPLYLASIYALIMSGEKFESGHKIRIN